jgi:hypothetical protein
MAHTMGYFPKVCDKYFSISIVYHEKDLKYIISWNLFFLMKRNLSQVVYKTWVLTPQ